MKKKVLVVVFITFIFVYVSGQNAFKNEFLFSKSLLENEKYELSISNLRFISQTLNLNNLQKDSLNYLLGWNYYYLKKLDTANIYLMQVHKNNSFYTKSRYYCAYNLAYSGYLDSSKYAFSTAPKSSPLLNELQTFELASVALLQRDMPVFDSLSELFTYNFYAFSKEEQNLINYRNYMATQKHKSMFLAGFLSALVPGLGKIYAGKIGGGTAAFLSTSILAAVTTENILKTSWKNPKSIIFGSLFTVFYIGNIWGSAFSVKIIEQENYEKANNSILLDMHIPLRTIFK